MAQPNLLESARELHSAGRLGDAAVLYERILSKNPADADALYGLAMVQAQTGCLSKAEEMLTAALANEPAFAEAWRARGLVLQHLGRPAEAMACYDFSLMLAPDFAAARRAREFLLREIRNASPLQNPRDRMPESVEQWIENGSRLAAAGRYDDALASFEHAIALAPANVKALCNKATVLFEKGLLNDALAVFDNVIQMEPGCALGWNNRGNALLSLGRADEAIQSYERALEVEPNLVEAVENRELALFMTRRNRRSPANYLRGLFDRFADHYDRAMIDGLRYQAHWQIRDLAARHLLPDLTLLELGCGTGLLGKALRELMRIRRLDGIDISPRMIAAAKASAAYDRLVLGDIEKILAEPDSLYDAVVSSDALNYFGDLSAIIAGVSRRLKAGGLFLFTTEMFDGEGWQQTPVHRFQHSQQYLRTEAERSGFEIVEIRPCTLRFENGRPVAGFVIVLTKPLAGQQ